MDRLLFGRMCVTPRQHYCVLIYCSQIFTTFPRFNNNKKKHPWKERYWEQNIKWWPNKEKKTELYLGEKHGIKLSTLCHTSYTPMLKFIEQVQWMLGSVDTLFASINFICVVVVFLYFCIAPTSFQWVECRFRTRIKHVRCKYTQYTRTHSHSYKCMHEPKSFDYRKLHTIRIRPELIGWLVGR